MTIDMFHEVHGEGFPTILLHGGIGASEMFGDVVPRLAEGRQVITPHLQGHGRTPDVDRPLRAEDLADDVAALAATLGHDRVDLVGYSFGGGAAFQAAVRHPALVRRLVLVSRPLRSDAWFPEAQARFAQMEATAAQFGPAVQAGPLGTLYPDVDFTRLFTKMGELVARPHDWTAEAATLTCPTMLVMADADGFDPAHYVEVFKGLGGALEDPGLPEMGGERVPHRLAIVPGVTHYDVLTGSPLAAEAIAGFLDG